MAVKNVLVVAAGGTLGASFVGILDAAEVAGAGAVAAVANAGNASARSKTIERMGDGDVRATKKMCFKLCFIPTIQHARGVLRQSIAHDSAGVR